LIILFCLRLWNIFYIQNVLLNYWQVSFERFSLELLLLQWVLGLGVLWVILYLIYQYYWSLKWLNELIYLEFIWTVLPGVILVWLGLPRLKLLYQHEALVREMGTCRLALKIVGHQWYWRYDLNQIGVNFDSFIDKEITNSYFNGGVDLNLVLPFGLRVLTLVTREDVLHAFALPPIYIKVDATPARLNSSLLDCGVPSKIFGTCSELCGIEHSSIPIVVEFASLISFLNWVKTILI